MKHMPSLSEDEFELFQELLVAESGLYFEKDRDQSLRYALQERNERRRFDSFREYYNLLKYHPEGQLEIRELIDLLTIGETYFFRNKPHFDALIKFVLPEIIQKKMYSADKSIRVWNAGCSRGDEPYSVAIAVMEVLPSYGEWKISILGTDVNRGALFEAKEAVYGQKDIGHLPCGYLEKYFHRRGTKYVLDDSVKKLVRFESHNLAKDPFALEGMDNLDIIFCRNVTIYFDRKTTKRVVEGFYDCLGRNGYLFIGHAETLWQITDKFETIEFPQTFVYKKTVVSGEEERPFMGIPEIKLEEFVQIEEVVVKEVPVENEKPAAAPERAAEVPAEDVLDPLYQEGTALFNEKQYDEAMRVFDKILARNKSHVRAHFAKATIFANQEKYNDAVDKLKEIIEADNLYVEAYYLLGILSYKIGDYQEAARQFEKVIYVDPALELAHFNLGNIYLYRQKFYQAAREFKNAIKLLEKKSREERVRFSEDFTVEFLLRACRNNLEGIGKNE